MKFEFKKAMLLALVVALVSLIAACGSKNADNTGAAGKKLTIGTDTSYVPFEFLDESTGKYVGFDIDLLDAISKEVGFEYELKPMDFNGLIPALQTNTLDMVIAGVTIKDDRKKIVDFSEPYYDAGTSILVRADDDRIKSVADLKGKTIATKQGTASYDYALKVESVGKVVPFPNIDQAYMELAKGSADAVVFDTPNVLYYIKTSAQGKMKVVGEQLAGQQFGIAFPKGGALRDKVNEALKKFKENGTYDEIYKKWFGDQASK